MAGHGDCMACQMWLVHLMDWLDERTLVCLQCGQVHDVPDSTVES